MNEPFNWHDIERKAMHFSVAWATEDDERGEAKTFWDEFFQIFNVRRQMRHLYGRLKNAYRYSNFIVYKNLHFNNAHEALNGQTAAVKAVEAAAHGVLDLRKTLQAGGKSLADLYDPLKMPAELLAPHHRLDLAVDACYGIKKGFGNEAGRVRW